MNLIFWNVQRSGLDEGGWLEDGITSLIHSNPAPEAVILCELTSGYADQELGTKVGGWGWQVVPADPPGNGGTYTRPTSLRLAAIQPNGGPFRSRLLGRAAGQTKPGLMLTRTGTNERVIGVHLPAQFGVLFDPTLPVNALAAIGASVAASGLAGAPVVSALVGDLNVDARNPVELAAFNVAMAANVFNPFARVRSGRPTRSPSELDWALVDPAVINPAVTKINWSRTPAWNDDNDFIPGTSAKRSDHSPIRLAW